MSLPSRGVLGATLALLAVALAWQLGHRSGAREVERRAAERLAATRATEATRAAEAASIVPSAEETVPASALAAAERERDIARATVESLRDELARSGELVAADRAELELYRRIGSDELPRGLALDSIERRAGPPPTLALTLVQVRGRERVAGRVEVGVEGAETEDETGVTLWGAEFDLRFFETLEVPLQGLEGDFPEAIVVDVLPEDGRHEPFRRRIAREEIRIVD